MWVAEYTIFKISSVWVQWHFSFQFKGDISRLCQICHILASEAYRQDEEKHFFKYVKLVCTEISDKEITFNFPYLYKLIFNTSLKNQY